LRWLKPVRTCVVKALEEEAVEADASETTIGVEVADSSLNHTNNIVNNVPMFVQGTATTVNEPIAAQMEDAVDTAKTEALATKTKHQEARTTAQCHNLATKAAPIAPTTMLDALVTAQDAAMTTTDLSIHPINNISSARTLMWQKNLNQTVHLWMNTNRTFHKSQQNSNNKRKMKCWNKWRINTRRSSFQTTMKKEKEIQTTGWWMLAIAELKRLQLQCQRRTEHLKQKEQMHMLVTLKRTQMLQKRVIWCQ